MQHAHTLSLKQAEVNTFGEYIVCGTVNEFYIAEYQCSTFKKHYFKF
jgi:hypothetical protein